MLVGQEEVACDADVSEREPLAHEEGAVQQVGVQDLQGGGQVLAGAVGGVLVLGNKMILTFIQKPSQVQSRFVLS